MDVNRNLETHDSILLCSFLHVGISTSGMKAGLPAVTWGPHTADGKFWMQLPKKKVKVRRFYFRNNIEKLLSQSLSERRGKKKVKPL